MDAERRRVSLRAMAVVLLVVAATAGCSKSSTGPEPAGPTRTYVMGFSWYPPRPELSLALQVVDQWAPRADAALLLTSPPWDSLLAGRSAEALVRANQLGLANLYRSKGLRVIASVDPTNGLDRSSDAPELVAAGRSLAEPAVQHLYRDFVVALDTLVHPDWLGVASETNFVRAIAPPGLYAGVRQAANDAATAVHGVDPTAKLFVTIQVEVAWGRPAGSYIGIAQDHSDFPFVAAWGLSSFPYLGGYTAPDSLPSNYYARLVEGDALPLLVIEGGWPSETVSGIASSPVTQRRYLVKQARLLDAVGAIGWFQITFTDLEVAAYSPGIEPFSRNGLVSTTFAPKPALAAWDSVFALPRR